MGNCATKPKTKGDDDAPPPPPAEPQTPGTPAEGERKEDEVVAAPEEAQGPVEGSQAVLAPKSEEATSAATGETKEPDEPKDEAPNQDDVDSGREKEAAGADAELQASAPAKVA